MAAPATKTRLKNKRKGRGTRVRTTVELSDGTIAVRKAQPAKRMREADDDVVSTYEYLVATLTQPTAFRIFDHVPWGPGLYGGGPRTWPNELYSFLYCAQFIYPSMREIIREISGDPNRRQAVISAALSNIPKSEQGARDTFESAVAAGRFPTRSAVERFHANHVDRKRVTELLTSTGIDLAVSRGHFDPSTLANMADPDIRNVVYSDGTVLKPPSDETFRDAIDPKTGIIWKPKTDVGSRQHKQNSESEPIVNGTKITTLLTRASGYGSEIFLGVTLTDAPDPASEANDALDLLDAARQELHEHHSVSVGENGGTRLRDIQVISHDGAATTEHHKRLVDSGTLLMNMPPPKAIDYDLETGKKIRVEEFKGKLGIWGHSLPDCPGHTLVGIAGDIHEQVKVGGKYDYRKSAHQPITKQSKGKAYYYETVTIGCPTSSQRGTHTAESLRIPWHQARDETDDNYTQRMRYSRPWGPSSETGRRLRGVRQSVENRFSMLDRRFPFKRIPAYSQARKLSLVTGYMLGHNLAMAGLHQRAGP